MKPLPFDAVRDGTHTSQSPCIKVCQLDLQNRCRGCGRTIDEIRDWSSMSLAERAAVNRRIGFMATDENR